MVATATELARRPMYKAPIVRRRQTTGPRDWYLVVGQVGAGRVTTTAAADRLAAASAAAYDRNESSAFPYTITTIDVFWSSAVR